MTTNGPGPRQGQRPNDTRPGPDRPSAFIGVRDDHPPAGAVAQAIPNLPAPIAEIDDQLHEAGLREPFDRVHDERPAGDFEQRFRDRVRERPHALAAPGREDHGSHGIATA